jgi:hypothetical protein
MEGDKTLNGKVHPVVNKSTGECYYDKWFTKSIVKYMGYAFRSAPSWKFKGILDANVAKWQAQSGIHWENKYQMCHPQPESNYRGTSKYEREQPYLDPSAWELSGAWTFKHFQPYMGNSHVVSYEVAKAEAIKTTSPGYPHNLAYQKKQEYMNAEEHIENSEIYWERLATSDPVPTFWNLADKYELRSIDKIKLGKIRAFCASSETHSHANTRLCHDMNQKFYRSAGKSASFVGATKFYGGWNRMIWRLKKHKLGFELDESDYDASIFRAALWGQCDMRYDFLAPEHQTPENMQRMHNLYYDIIHSIMVTPLGDVLVKDTGNPSGQGNTIVDNTMILYRLLAYAWILLWRKQHSGHYERIKEIEAKLMASATEDDPDYDEETLENELEYLRSSGLTYLRWTQLVELVLNGDDNTFSVDDSVIGWYNSRNIAAIWTSIGVTTKSPHWEPLPVEELNFLSHSTRYDESLGIYLPVPEHSRIMDSLLYANESNDVRWSLLRAYALRIESWGNLQTRDALWKYINYVWRTYEDELSGSVRVPTTGEMMSYGEIANLLMSDREIAKLYCGFESTSNSSVSVRDYSVLECVRKKLYALCDSPYQNNQL